MLIEILKIPLKNRINLQIRHENSQIYREKKLF